jgi:ribonuclease III
VPPEGGAAYELALTHSSYAFEHGEPNRHNERLELLGDSILGAIVTGLIYRAYPEMPEGRMSLLRASVVNMDSLAALARSLGLGEHILLGRGEEMSGGRDKSSLLADTFEAVIGAVWEQRGFEAATRVIEPLFRPLLEAEVQSDTRFDTKTALQEIVARESRARPSYEVDSSGPDHDRRFTARVYIGSDLCGTGTGRSKKDAEQEAAREALERLGGGRGARAS